jgi:hypothetical protein
VFSFSFLLVALQQQLSYERTAHEATARDAQQLKINAHIARERERARSRDGEVSDGQSSREREREMERDREGRGEETGQQNLSLSGISTPTAVMPWRTEENKKSVTASAPKSTEMSKAGVEGERHDAHHRRVLEEEHRDMQMELMRTGRALESLQQLLKDRDKTSARKERLFLTEKEMLVSEAEQATRAFQSAKEEVLYLLRERDHTARSLDEFSRQLCNMAWEGDDTDLSISPPSVHRSPSDRMSARHATPSAEGKSSGLLSTSTSSSGSGSGSGSSRGEGSDTAVGVGVGVHAGGWSSMTRIDSTEEQRRVKRGEGAIELDGMILSMQSVVNDRKRVRRLCRQQQLSIMALR